MNDLDELPPAGDRGGLTKPCEPHQSWGETLPPPPGGYRSAGRMCSGMLGAVQLPACSAKQILRAVRADQWARDPGSNVWSVRGYLRRHALATHAVDFGPGIPALPRDFDRAWSLRVEAQAPGGACGEVRVAMLALGAAGPTQRPDELCVGDSTVACCRADAIERDVEVVAEYAGESDRVSLCLVVPATQPPRALTILRTAERGTQSIPSTKAPRLPDE